MITIEQLAEELHKFYRAAFKALTDLPDIGAIGTGHDHGWSHCNKKKYFMNRAKNLRDTLSDPKNGQRYKAIFFNPTDCKLRQPHTPHVDDCGTPCSGKGEL